MPNPPDPTDEERRRSLEFELWRRGSAAARRFTVSFMSEDPALPEGRGYHHVGTGVIVRLGSEYVALTAAHVIEALCVEELLGHRLHFCLGDRIVPLDEARCFHTGASVPRSPSADSADRADAGVIRFIPQQVIDADLSAHALPIERVVPSPEPARLGPWQAYGFPAKGLFLMGGSALEDGSFMVPFHVVCNTAPLDPDHHVDDLHIVLTVDSMTTEAGRAHPPWDARGVSGSGFWGLCAPRDQIDSWSPERMVLAGLCHTAVPKVLPFDGRYEALVGTHPREHLELAYKNIPECRSAILKAHPRSGTYRERPEEYLKFDKGGLPLPPWQLFPYWPTSMGWRMGSGDWYMGWWQVWYDSTDDERKCEYRRRYPAPLYWFDFYWSYGAGCAGTLALIFMRFVSFPVCFVAYWWYRIVRDGVPPDGHHQS